MADWSVLRLFGVNWTGIEESWVAENSIQGGGELTNSEDHAALSASELAQLDVRQDCQEYSKMILLHYIYIYNPVNKSPCSFVILVSF